jgi:hypothetical protein
MTNTNVPSTQDSSQSIISAGSKSVELIELISWRGALTFIELSLYVPEP